MSDHSGTTNEQYRTAIDGYRSIAKWVVSSVGAVAGALVVGVQVSSLGDVRGWQLFWSGLSLAVVFGGILVILIVAARLLSPLLVNYRGFAKSRDFKPLRDDLKADPTPLGNDLPDVKTAADLAVVYETSLIRTKSAQDADDKESTNATEKNLKEAKEDQEVLYERIMQLTWKGRYLRTKEMYSQTMAVLYACIVLAVIGAAGFAYFGSAPTESAEGKSTTVKITGGGERFLNWPRSCARLYFALGKLATEQPRVGPLWPKGSLSPWDRKCGLDTRSDVQQALEFLGHP